MQGACEVPTAFAPTLEVALVNRHYNCMQCVGLVAVPAHVVLVGMTGATCGSVAIVVSSVSQMHGILAAATINTYMKKVLKCTPRGLLILGNHKTALALSVTEQHEPTAVRMKHATGLAKRIQNAMRKESVLCSTMPSPSTAALHHCTALLHHPSHSSQATRHPACETPRKAVST